MNTFADRTHSDRLSVELRSNEISTANATHKIRYHSLSFPILLFSFYLDLLAISWGIHGDSSILKSARKLMGPQF